MRKNQNVVVIVLEWLLAIVVGGLMAFFVLKNLFNDSRPLAQADIPQETIDWFNGLIHGGSDIGGIFDPDDRDPSDWTRYESIDSMYRLEDHYFVIYYSQKDSLVEKEKAKMCQRYAHNAISEGLQLMKKYPYPNTINDRKLPIFLAKTVTDYQSICEQLGHSFPGQGTIGLYCFHYGGSSVYTDGILISPEAWGPAGDNPRQYVEDESFKKTLWHEMNHFMYFTNWDYRQTSKPCLWFTEGLAEYFSGNYDRLREVKASSSLNLTDDFRGPGNAAYWGGMSAYLCLEKNFSKSHVSNVVENSYTHSINESLSIAIPNYSLSLWNEQWHNFMDNKEYKKYI